MGLPGILRQPHFRVFNYCYFVSNLLLKDTLNAFL